MRIATFAPLFAAALALSTAAHADTIGFNSIAGSTTYTYVSGQGLFNGTGGTATAYQNGAYATPLSGSQWVSTNIFGGDGAIGVTDYTDQITLLADETYTGTLSFLADDVAGVVINGVEVYAPNSSTGYTSPTTINLLPNYFRAGANTITLEDSNTGAGPAAVDFAGSITGVAPTPEPSSLILLGTGIVGAAVFARRRMA